MSYYIEKVGDDRYDMRQVRYRGRFIAGNEHPHDLMATHFTAAGMRELIAKHFADAEIDTSVLPPVDS